MVNRIVEEIKRIPVSVLLIHTVLLSFASIVGFYSAIESLFPYEDMTIIFMVASTTALILVWCATVVNTAYAMSMRVKRR